MVKDFAAQLDDSSRVLKDLDGLDPGKIIEKPAAAGVHEHGMALKLQKFQGRLPIVREQCTDGLLRQKSVKRFCGSIENDVDVTVARLPGIFEKNSGRFLTTRFGAF